MFYLDCKNLNWFFEYFMYVIILFVFLINLIDNNFSFFILLFEINRLIILVYIFNG